MQKICLVIPNGSNSPIALSTAIGIFRMAQSKGLDIEFCIAGLNRATRIEMGDFQLRTNCHIAEVEKVDLVVIPSIIGDPEQTLKNNQALIKWLKEKYEFGTQIISLCTGAYLLAATGLLDGKEASSHFMAMSDLEERFPKVRWRPERIITDQAQLLTSGGSLSSLNVLIYWLSKNFDQETVLNISKIIQIDYPRISQKPFFIFSNQKGHGDQQILQVQEYLEQVNGELLQLDEVARKFNLSRRTLNRRFKMATGQTPKNYLQRAKIEQAKSMLEKEALTIKEVMYRLGYNDENSFRQLFKKITGMLPNEYRKKFYSLQQRG